MRMPSLTVRARMRLFWMLRAASLISLLATGELLAERLEGRGDGGVGGGVALGLGGDGAGLRRGRRRRAASTCGVDVVAGSRAPA